MNGSTWNLTTSRFALAAAFAVGIAASPLGFGHGAWLNTAAAQEADNAADADAESSDLGRNDESGEAEEFPSNPALRTGGTGEIGISSGEQRYADPSSVNVAGDPDFQRYSEAVENNDLEEAGIALHRVADRPITDDYVAEVNEQLGVQTSLTDSQIAEAAKEEPLPY